MICVTGDTHGDQVLWNSCINNSLNDGDIIIVLGDFGFGFFDGRYWPEEMFYDYLSGKKYTVLFIDKEDFLTYKMDVRNHTEAELEAIVGEILSSCNL